MGSRGCQLSSWQFFFKLLKIQFAFINIIKTYSSTIVCYSNDFPLISTSKTSAWFELPLYTTIIIVLMLTPEWFVQKYLMHSPISWADSSTGYNKEPTPSVGKAIVFVLWRSAVSKQLSISSSIVWKIKIIPNYKKKRSKSKICLQWIYMYNLIWWKDGTCLRKRDRDPLLTILVEPHDTHIGMEDYNPCW